MIQPGMLLQHRYQVIRELGEGGFGKTFEVSDAGTPKVLKVLLANYSKAVSLFQREAEVLKRLEHAGIPKVEPDGYFTELFGAAEPLHCLVMEFIEGQNLQKWLSDNQPISEERAIDWLKQLAEILHQVHQQQYFHRDVKPSNIMLKPDGQLVLIDFGAVREVTETYLRKVEQKDVTGMISPGYTPQEQYDGQAEMKSDFFALGRTFVHLLTGQHPIDFYRDSQTGELIWRDSAPQVSESLADLIDFLMAPFPGLRPENTQAILDYLEAVEKGLPALGKKPVAVPPTSGQEDRIKTIPTASQTKSLAISKMIKVMVGLAVLLPVGLLSWPYLSSSIARELYDRGFESSKAGELGKAEFCYRLALLLDPNFAEIHFSLGKLYEKGSAFDQAEAEYQRSITIKPDFDKAYNNLGRLYILKKESSAAIITLKKGLELSKEPEVKYALLKNLGWALKEEAGYEEAKVYLQEAIALDGKRAPAHCLLAQVLEVQGNRVVALEKWKNCLRYGSEDNPDEIIWMSQARKRLKSKNTQK
jgi:serine/threonine protein kinase